MSVDIKVSVICASFNQEKYIRKALDGLVMQRTNFPFEILVHDDASKDNTGNIIREYAEKYPNLIRAFIREENQFSQGKDIIYHFLLPRTRGEFIALCEGDDFWTDPYKLQKQYDAMMAHPECSMILHKVQGISENEKNNICTFPEKSLKEGIVKSSDVIHRMLQYNEWIFHTTAYMIRKNNLLKANEKQFDFYLHPMYGDQAVIFLSAMYGDFYYIDSIMSCYRMGAIGSTVKKDKNQTQRGKRCERQIRALLSFDKESNGIFHEDIVFALNRQKFILAETRQNYRYMLQKDMKIYFDELPLNAKIHVRIAALFPVFDKVYYGLRKKIKGF